MDFSQYTPPASQSPSSDFDSDAFFFNTYVPLSSFPTPPPSCHSRKGSNQLPPEALLSSPYLSQTLLGPSIHLANLIPSSASLLDPCNETVHNILVRAALPMGTLSLACGILDSLNSKFANSWRRSLPLSTTPASTTSQVETRAPGAGDYFGHSGEHIDNIRPEVILLSALVIATKFLDDQQAPTRYYAEKWAQKQWTCQMINATEQCIMANLQYRILPLTDAVLIKEAEEDMEKAGYFARRNSALSAFGPEGVLTPALTPLMEDCIVAVTKPKKTFGSCGTGLGLGLKSVSAVA